METQSLHPKRCNIPRSAELRPGARAHPASGLLPSTPSTGSSPLPDSALPAMTISEEKAHPPVPAASTALVALQKGTRALEPSQSARSRGHLRLTAHSHRIPTAFRRSTGSEYLSSPHDVWLARSPPCPDPAFFPEKEAVSANPESSNAIETSSTESSTIVPAKTAYGVRDAGGWRAFELRTWPPCFCASWSRRSSRSTAPAATVARASAEPRGS